MVTEQCSCKFMLQMVSTCKGCWNPTCSWVLICPVYLQISFYTSLARNLWFCHGLSRCKSKRILGKTCEIYENGYHFLQMYPSVNNTSCQLVEPTQQCHNIPEATTKRAHGEILAHIVVMRYVSTFANCSPFKSHTTKSFFSEHDIMYLPLQAMPRPTTSSAWCWKTILK